jgi:hypothetical protein
MRRDSRNLRRRSRISFACLCLAVSKDAFIARSERFVISRSAICNSGRQYIMSRVKESAYIPFELTLLLP